MVELSKEEIGKLMYLIDCAVRFTPAPNGGLNMSEEIRDVLLKLAAAQAAPSEPDQTEK